MYIYTTHLKTTPQNKHEQNTYIYNGIKQKQISKHKSAKQKINNDTSNKQSQTRYI